MRDVVKFCAHQSKTSLLILKSSCVHDRVLDSIRAGDNGWNLDAEFSDETVKLAYGDIYILVIRNNENNTYL